MRKLVNFVASYLEIEQLDVISDNNLATELVDMGYAAHFRVSSSFPLLSFPPRGLLFNPRGAFGVGGNPSLHHCMGPRIREDDKIVNPSCPRPPVIPPEHFFLMRGVLSAKERHPPSISFQYEGCSSRMFLSGTGIHPCHNVWVPASARTTR